MRSWGCSHPRKSALLRLGTICVRDILLLQSGLCATHTKGRWRCAHGSGFMHGNHYLNRSASTIYRVYQEKPISYPSVAISRSCIGGSYFVTHSCPTWRRSTLQFFVVSSSLYREHHVSTQPMTLPLKGLIVLETGTHVPYDK